MSRAPTAVTRALLRELAEAPGYSLGASKPGPEYYAQAFGRLQARVEWIVDQLAREIGIQESEVQSWTSRGAAVPEAKL